MRGFVFCLPAIALTGGLAITATLPALARSGTFAAGSRRSAIASHVRPAPRPSLASPVNKLDNSAHLHVENLNRGPIAVWPYPWAGDTIPVEVPQYSDEGPSRPPVIVIAGSPRDAGEPTAPPDYSYVAGCHAIPNGYHCDIPHTEVAPPER